MNQCISHKEILKREIFNLRGQHNLLESNILIMDFRVNLFEIPNDKFIHFLQMNMITPKLGTQITIIGSLLIGELFEKYIRCDQ